MNTFSFVIGIIILLLSAYQTKPSSGDHDGTADPQNDISAESAFGNKIPKILIQVTRFGRIPKDYYQILRGANGSTRPSPGLIATPYGVSVFPTIGPTEQYPSSYSYTNYSFFKAGKVK